MHYVVTDQVGLVSYTDHAFILRSDQHLEYPKAWKIRSSTIS
jgi:hypothetical protein